jgi:O-antigen/teichoic acid export membrane protein
MSKEILKGTTLLSSAFVLVAILNFLFYRVAIYLSADEFGILVALINISNIIVLLSDNLAGFITKIVAEGKVDLNLLRKYIVPKLLIAEGLIALTLIILSFLVIAKFLQLDNPWVLLSLLSFMPTLLFVGFFKGLIRGKKLFGKLAINQISEAILKLIAGFTAVFLGYKVGGIVTAMGLATFINIGLLYWFTKDLKNSGTFVAKEVFNKKALFNVSGGLLVLSLFVMVDALIARNNLSGQQAGIYSAVVTYGKFVYYFIFTIITVAFPIFSTQTSSKEALKNLVFALGLAALIGSGIVIGFVLFGNLIVEKIIGQQYAQAGSYLWLEGINMTIYCLFAIVANFLIAKNKTKVSYIIGIGFVGFCMVLTLMAGSLQAMFIAKGIIFAVLLVCSLLYLLSLKNEY